MLSEIEIKMNAEADDVLGYYVREVLDLEQYAVEFKDPAWISAKIYCPIERTEEILDKVKHFMLEIPSFGVDPGKYQISVLQLEDEDWLYSWRKYFKPIPVGNKLCIRPPWEEPLPGMLDLILDPKMGFGTGQHPTTYLCLEQLVEDSLSGKKILDIGAGSGILGVAALLMGAAWADMVEKDPVAIESCEETVVNNKVEARSGIFEANVLKETPAKILETSYDLGIINIIAEILVEVIKLPWISNIRELYLSGIISEKREIVLDQIEKMDFIIARERNLDQWYFYKLVKKIT